MTFWQERFWTANLIGQFDLSCLLTRIVRQLLIPSSLPTPQKSNNNFHAADCVQITEAAKAQEKLGFDHGQPIWLYSIGQY